jgi:hypothetical protein
MDKINLKQVVIWGHLLHSHTHSYIHNAFYIAFRNMGFTTYWFDDNTDVSGIDFGNSLFITEHNVDKKIPKMNDCLYFVHFLEQDNYQGVNKECLIDLKCAFRDMKRDSEKYGEINYVPVTKKRVEFFASIQSQLTYYTLWGTDLLPNEIDENIKNLDEIRKKRTGNFFFVGQPTRPWMIVQNICYSNKIPFIRYGATFNKDSEKNMTIEQNVSFIQQTIMAPAFQSDEQVKDIYIPCRIFKNISYGRMSATNNPLVYKLFSEKIVYDSDISVCINKLNHFENNYNKNIVKQLMEYVRDNHTFVQRIESLRHFINDNTLFNLTKI